MKRWALTIAAGPKYWPSFQNTGHDVVHAAHRMHLVVSSKRSRSSADCSRSRVGSLPVGDQERHDVAVRLEERLHVDDQVLEHRQALDRLDRDRLARVEVLDQRLAGQPVAAVDPHRVRAADAVRARAAEGQRAVLLPLDLVQARPGPGPSGRSSTWKSSQLRLVGDLRVVAADPEGDRDQVRRRSARPRPAPAECLSSVGVLISTCAPSAGSGSGRPACSRAGSTRCRRRRPRGRPWCAA